MTKLLKWQTAVQMRSQLALEIELGLNWRMGYGAALMGVNWWQCRRLESHDLSIPLLADIVAAQTGQDPSEAFWEVQSAMSDPAMFDRMASFIRSLSPIVSLGMARTIVEGLQKTGYASIPVPYTFKSQPRWTAWRPGVEVLFRDLTGDLQEDPWVCWRGKNFGDGPLRPGQDGGVRSAVLWRRRSSGKGKGAMTCGCDRRWASAGSTAGMRSARAG